MRRKSIERSIGGMGFKLALFDGACPRINSWHGPPAREEFIYGTGWQPVPRKAPMRAMVLEWQAAIESAPLELRDVPDPVPGPREVRLRVTCCAICRTDLHIIEGDLPLEKRPVIPGHQIVGMVDQVGPSCS